MQPRLQPADVSYSSALADVSFTCCAAEESDMDSAPSVSCPFANPNPHIATADCERGFSVMSCIETFPQNCKAIMNSSCLFN